MWHPNDIEIERIPNTRDAHFFESIKPYEIRVTVVRNKCTHESKGLAFILYLRKEDAQKAAAIMNDKKILDRTLKCSLAKDNGRAKDYIKRKEYKDKSRCFECGEFGHLSYKCPRNTLGDRQPPKKKRKQGKSSAENNEKDEPDIDFDSSSHISTEVASETSSVKNKQYTQGPHFSDEEYLYAE
ncbi:unnamed protein product [Clavelina lepadiformis]|uniref:CCHC-type domain-containing protein n=1 Tax=Clavelina lepadiformis TaxID=159417 RepID=A0ABP0G0U3_CLALP